MNNFEVTFLLCAAKNSGGVLYFQTFPDPQGSQGPLRFYNGTKGAASLILPVLEYHAFYAIVCRTTAISVEHCLIAIYTQCSLNVQNSEHLRISWRVWWTMLNFCGVCDECCPFECDKCYECYSFSVESVLNVTHLVLLFKIPIERWNCSQMSWHASYYQGALFNPVPEECMQFQMYIHYLLNSVMSKPKF